MAVIMGPAGHERLAGPGAVREGAGPDVRRRLC